MARPSDRHWLPASALAPRVRVEGATTRVSSHWIAMRDGVRIAIDLHLPEGRGRPERIPAIVRQTRYLRSLDVRPPFDRFHVAAAFDLNAETRKTFLRAGYAWVDVDVRGTGNSSGAWQAPWFEDEVRDGAELVDWIVRQPWSNGRVGSLGISYDGTCAEMLLVNKHPAVKAVAPLFSLFDVYADVAFPGGVHLAWFTDAWSRYNAALDRGAFGEAMSLSLSVTALAASRAAAPAGLEHVFGPLGRMDEARLRRGLRTILDRMIRGGKGVDGATLTDEERAQRSANLDVHASAAHVVYRDDTGVHPSLPERTIDHLSPHHYARDVAASGAAVYGYSGWRDGGYPNGAAKRWNAVPNAGSRLTLGPWAHTGKLRIHGLDSGKATEFAHAAELLDFFDEHLYDEPSRGDRRPVHYFVLGEERWRSADTWPPPGTTARSLYVRPGWALGARPAEMAAVDPVPVDPDVGTGPRSRWRSLIALVAGDYPDRRARDGRLLVVESPPLEETWTMAGHAIVSLHLSWSDPRAARIFAYLEDVAPDGRVGYVTEGALAAVHRACLAGEGELAVPRRTFARADGREVGADEIVELTFDLQPVAYAWRRGHRIRLALAAADADHFAPPAGGGVFRLHSGRELPSKIVLPLLAEG